MNTGGNSKQKPACAGALREKDAAAQRTGLNTLDNWGHKTPTQSKRIKDRKETIKGSWPGTCIQYTRLHIQSLIYTTQLKTGSKQRFKTDEDSSTERKNTWQLGL